jgi:hypothetical protein
MRGFAIRRQEGIEPRPSVRPVAHHEFVRRLTLVSLGAAVGLSIALLLAGLLVPLAASESSSSSGQSTSSAQTLVESEGMDVLIVLAIPLVISLLVVAAFRFERHTAAWVLTGSLGCFAVLALLSIGIYVLPVVVALAVACGTARPGIV